MTDERGLYDKFEPIKRTDGRSARGKRHDGCRYLPLDLTHDLPARLAARFYAVTVMHTRPALAHDLIVLLDDLDRTHPLHLGEDDAE